VASILNAFDSEALQLAAKTIQQGGLVAFPTETVYGLGADARNPMAVARIFEVKRRPSIDPLIVHVASAEEAEKYGRLEHKNAHLLMRQFWPGPLTLVVPKRELVPQIVTAGLATVALRMPAHETALALIRRAGTAIAAPSANPFGYLSPTDAGHVSREMSQQIDIILDGGKCSVGVESTIISLIGSKPVLLRPGGTPVEELEKVLGEVQRFEALPERPEAPGQLKRHYATRTRLEVFSGVEHELSIRLGERIGVLSLGPLADPGRYAAVEVLSSSGNLREAAANLFAALRRLDEMDLERIVALPVPEIGLGIAIMDRLTRCSARE